jgi:group I intron endonuclease
LDKHGNSHLQRSWNKYGENSFRFEIVEELPTSQLQSVEQQYLDWCKAISEWSYNIGYDAECSSRGRKFTPEQIEQLKIVQRRNWAEGKFSNRKHSHCKPRLGILHSDESKQLISLHSATRGNPGTMLGKHLTPEQCKKVSLSLLGSKRHLDKTIYSLFNKYTGQLFVGTTYALQQRHQVPDKIRSVVKGTRKNTEGWVLCL